MAKKVINVGTNANPTGDSLKNAFTKVNENFTELYNALGLDSGNLNIGAFEFEGNVLKTTDSTPIVLDQSVTITSDLRMQGDVLPEENSKVDLGSASKQWKNLYISNGNSVFFGNNTLTVTDDGTIFTNGVAVATPGGSTSWSSITGKPTFATVATSGNYIDLNNKPTIPTDISNLTDTTNVIKKNAVTVGDTPPVSPSTGMLWYDTVSGRMYIYYDSSWVDSNPRL